MGLEILFTVPSAIQRIFYTPFPCPKDGLPPVHINIAKSKSKRNITGPCAVQIIMQGRSWGVRDDVIQTLRGNQHNNPQVTSFQDYMRLVKARLMGREDFVHCIFELPAEAIKMISKYEHTHIITWQGITNTQSLLVVMIPYKWLG